MTRRLGFAVAVLFATLSMAAGPGVAQQQQASVPGARPIARIWRGRTLAARADEYTKYLDATGVKQILATPGNLGVTVMRRTEKGETEFLVMSLWESIEAVQRFAGKDYRKAVIMPRDREFLLKVEPNVDHYEIARDERGDLRGRQP
jgi:heme-degrading monooxygenase HmoA